MNTQVNWQKIRSEINRLTDVDKLRDEVHRIGSEIRKFDFHSVLSPAAQQKVKVFEKRYANLMRTIHQAQRQMDREFNRILRQVKGHRSDLDKVVAEQKNKLEKVSADLKKRFSATSAKSTVKSTAKKAAGTTRRKASAARGAVRKVKKA